MKYFVIGGETATPAVLPEGSDEWQTFVADAAAKEPSQRTEAQSKALRAAVAVATDCSLVASTLPLA